MAFRVVNRLTGFLGVRQRLIDDCKAIQVTVITDAHMVEQIRLLFVGVRDCLVGSTERHVVRNGLNDERFRGTGSHTEQTAGPGTFAYYIE